MNFTYLGIWANDFSKGKFTSSFLKILKNAANFLSNLSFLNRCGNDNGGTIGEGFSGNKTFHDVDLFPYLFSFFLFPGSHFLIFNHLVVNLFSYNLLIFNLSIFIIFGISKLFSNSNFFSTP